MGEDGVVKVGWLTTMHSMKLVVLHEHWLKRTMTQHICAQGTYNHPKQKTQQNPTAGQHKGHHTS